MKPITALSKMVPISPRCAGLERVEVSACLLEAPPGKGRASASAAFSASSFQGLFRTAAAPSRVQSWRAPPWMSAVMTMEGDGGALLRDRHEQVEAAHHGHQQVRDEAVRPPRFDHRQGLLGHWRPRRLGAAAARGSSELAARELRVVHYENPSHNSAGLPAPLDQPSGRSLLPCDDDQALTSLGHVPIRLGQPHASSQSGP